MGNEIKRLSFQRKVIFWIAYLFGAVVVSLIFLETLARAIAGPPSQTLSFLLTSRAGLYPPNATLELRFGPIPYTVVSNSFGIRGPEFSLEPEKDTIRIVCIGDSITDGFFVNNEETYPFFLERYLRKQGYRCEVISIARGGCSIDLELARLRQIAVPLKPSIVVLIFVSNDIYELEGKKREEILSHQIKLTMIQKIIFPVLAQSKLVELIFQKYIAFASFAGKRKTEAYVCGEATKKAGIPDETSCSLNFDANIRIFWQRYGAKDGIVHVDKLSSSTQRLVDLYLEGLQEFARTCRENNIRLLFVYYPSYPQVYDVKTPMTIRNVLRDFCRHNGISFADLTPHYRRRPKDCVYEFAPLDFHPNPRGNEFLAHAIADSMIELNLLANTFTTSDMTTNTIRIVHDESTSSR